MADFNWDLVLEIAGDTDIIFKEVSKFPEVRRDLSLLIDKAVSFEKLENIALKVDKKILKSVNLFDVYIGKNLPQGKKSYALSFIMSDDTKTLTDKKIDKVMDKLIESFNPSNSILVCFFNSFSNAFVYAEHTSSDKKLYKSLSSKSSSFSR